MIRTWILLLFILTAVGLVAPGALAAPSSGPSFNCSRPSEIEAVICKDPILSADDRRMTSLYSEAKPGALGLGSNQLAAQRKWLKELNVTCADAAWTKFGFKSLRACVGAYYDDRLQQLAVASLLVSPMRSLGEIRRINPQAAPIYEAAAQYATIDDPARRAKTVETLLAPIYGAMDQNTRNSLRMVDGNAMSARAAARSDHNFAMFFDVASVFMLHGRLIWPCAVLVKRPGLINGLGSIWGGAIDGHVPASDCWAALPAVPEVADLSQAALRAQPPCEGTIRFSTGREYAKLIDAVRLHRTEIWESRDSTGGNLGADQRTFRRRHATETAKADVDLAAYYRRYFATSSRMAEHDSRTAIAALIGNAFDLCQ
ncbi:MAG: lysozyme inhibitor LprI family protein [Caulobacteraceae bacterium]